LHIAYLMDSQHKNIRSFQQFLHVNT
jgi:hypothetical protein